jgi:twitching motility protein PilT
MLEQNAADQVVLIPGERPSAIVDGKKKELGSERMGVRAILVVAGEVLSQDELRDLPTQRPRIVRHEQDGVQYVIEVAREGDGVRVAVRSAAPKKKKSQHLRMSRPPPRTSRPPPRTSRSPMPSAIVAPAEEVKIEIANVRSAETPRVRSGPAAIDVLLREMLAKSASDLHLSSGCAPAMRVHGEISFLPDRNALSSKEIFDLVRAVMTEKSARDFSEKHDADFAYELEGVARFRVNVFEDRNGTGAVLRQIPLKIQSATDLGLPKACLDLCNLSKGLVVVTGPTGSGKSTTLAAMIDHVNRTRSDHIITIEDPVEFVHMNQKCLVNQREVGVHTKSFSNALRAALREDPDIVLVGEMRDLETIAIAIETAETGHLVFGTLHTTTAVSTVDRIVDQFPPDRQAQIRVMLSESLKGVIAQVLCKKIGGGRVAAHEILLGTTAVSAIVREGKTFQLPSVMQTGKAQGMLTMNDSLLALVQKRLVDPKEAYVKAVDKNGLLSMFKSAGIAAPVS